MRIPSNHCPRTLGRYRHAGPGHRRATVHRLHRSPKVLTLPRLTKELGIAAVPHGFRSSFRDWAAERTNTPREVVEAALAHTVQNPTEAAYARSDLFERRRRLMDDWAAYLSGAHGQVRHDDGNRALRPGVLPTLQPTSR